jgi:peptide/nickel transport system substrate-binding protein
LLDKARVVPAVADRRAIYAEVWKLEREDMPDIYLWSAKNIVGISKTLQGFRQVPDGIIRLQGMQFAK